MFSTASSPLAQRAAAGPHSRASFYPNPVAEQCSISGGASAGALRDDRWAQVMDEARRMAANLQSRGFAQGSRIAIISKNRTHWLRADFALWMVGFVSVLRYPTHAAGTIGQRSITATPA